MAVTKLWPVRSNLKHVIDYAANKEKTSADTYTEEQYQALRDVLAYAKNEEKTEQEFYVQGINCNPTCARDQFVMVKEQFGKTDGIQAYHGYLSFKNMEVTPELAQRVGMEFAQRVWGDKYQVLVTCHLNTQHLHCHFVVNSISFVDGSRCHDETSWFRFSPIADEICRKYGLSVIQEPERNRNPYYITKKELAGIPTRQSILRETIDEIIPHCRNLDDFRHQLRQRGYRYNLNPSRKYWTVTPPGSEKSIRLYRLGDEYTNERIRERIDESFRSGRYTPPQNERYHRQYRMQTREHKLYEKTSLYRKYLYYCYKLGYLPKQQNRKPSKVHYLLRDDLIKLDRISQEVRLLGNYHIDNAEQLFFFLGKCSESLKQLESERKDLRNELKWNIPEERKSEIKEKISSISEEMKKLRKEISLCESIAERSEIISPKLQQIHAEESEQTKRGKEKAYEPWR
ncbi:MAG: relaxase/mobilization nuclease domain-containing protein [Erysipelotrichaceae bacterium]|nr:relaxase/mobilization nuclease domain-containing protein [Erysipelotrichaceae bacterium]